LVDDRNAFATRAIGVDEIAAATQRETQRLHVSWSDVGDVGDRAAALHSRSAVERAEAKIEQPRVRQAERDAGELHARNGAHTCEGIREQAIDLDRVLI